MNFSENLIDLMFKCKISSMSELSRKSGVPVSTLKKIKDTGGHTTQLPTLIKLADFFEITIDELIGRRIELTESQKHLKENQLTFNLANDRSEIITSKKHKEVTVAQQSINLEDDTPKDTTIEAKALLDTLFKIGEIIEELKAGD